MHPLGHALGGQAVGDQAIGLLHHGVLVCGAHVHSFTTLISRLATALLPVGPTTTSCTW